MNYVPNCCFHVLCKTMFFDVLCPGYRLEVYGFRTAQHREIYSPKTKGWLLSLLF